MSEKDININELARRVYGVKNIEKGLMIIYKDFLYKTGLTESFNEFLSSVLSKIDVLVYEENELYKEKMKDVLK